MKVLIMAMRISDSHGYGVDDYSQWQLIGIDYWRL